VPFIVTTKRPEPTYPKGEERAVNVLHPVSRRAVATLEDAQAYVSGLVSGMTTSADNHGARKTAADQLWSMPESGGSVGPLPDGTVIEVECTTWASLDRAALIAEHGSTLDPVHHTDRSLDCPESQVGEARQAQILDAYNAQAVA
jgi:hypothetical protein